MLADKLKGGLGIGSLEAFNFALFQKWRWRYVNENGALWVNVINEVHGIYRARVRFFYLIFVEMGFGPG